MKAMLIEKLRRGRSPEYKLLMTISQRLPAEPISKLDLISRASSSREFDTLRDAEFFIGELIRYVPDCVIQPHIQGVA